MLSRKHHSSISSFDVKSSSFDVKRFLARLIAFCLLMASILWILDQLAPLGWGNAVLAEKVVDFKKEQQDAIDVVFVGSSRVYRQIDVDLFDSKVPGVRSYNLGSPDSNLLSHIKIVEHIVGAPSPPKHVILEIQALPHLSVVNRHKFGSYYAHDLDRTILAASVCCGKQDFLQLKEHAVAAIDNSLKVGGLLRIAKSLSHQVFQDRVALHGRRGFIPLDDEMDVEEIAQRRSEFLQDPSELEVRRLKCLRERENTSVANDEQDDDALTFYLQNLSTDCSDTGVQLTFLIAPRVLGAYPVQRGIPNLPCLDLGDPSQHPELHQFETSFDVGHLNQAGAKMFTRGIAEEFLKLFSPQLNTSK